LVLSSELYKIVEIPPQTENPRLIDPDAGFNVPTKVSAVADYQ